MTARLVCRHDWAWLLLKFWETFRIWETFRVNLIYVVLIGVPELKRGFIFGLPYRLLPITWWLGWIKNQKTFDRIPTLKHGKLERVSMIMPSKKKKNRKDGSCFSCMIRKWDNEMHILGSSLPHIGKIPIVTPRAAEKANCLGSAPLHGIPTEDCQQPHSRSRWRRHACKESGYCQAECQNLGLKCSAPP